MKLRRHYRLLALGTALALALTACGGDETTDDTTPDPGGATDTGDDGGETDGEASGEPIRIGILTSFTGPFTPWGIQVRAGMELAAADINADGGVDGRSIELVEADDQNNPDEGVTALERMVEQDGVVAAGGVISSDVGLATARSAEELEVPLFMVKAGAAEILSSDSRYTFRTCLPAAPMIAGPIAAYIQDQGLSRVGAIIADYAWGQSVRGALEDEIGSLEGVDLQIEVAPVGEQDFSTYLRSLEEFDPEMIVSTGHPPGAGPITITADQLGLDVPVTGPYAPYATVFEGVGEVAFDRYADFGCADFTSPEYHELAARFAEESEFSFMEDDAVAGYAIVSMVAEAVTEVGDDPAAVAEYLHDNSFDMPGYVFPLSWTEWGELAEATPAFDIMVEATPPDGVNPGANWYLERLILPDPLEPYEP